LVMKIFDTLKGGDEFAAAGVPGEILDGVAGREHGFVVEEVGDVGNGEDDDFGEVFRAGLGAGGKGAGLFGFQVRPQTGAEQFFRFFFFRSPTNHIWILDFGMMWGACKGRDVSMRRANSWGWGVG